MISSCKNVLLIQLGDIGDVVLTTPTVRAIRETYPHARISILVRKPYGSLLAADPYLHEIVEFEKVRGTRLDRLRKYVEFVRRLRHARYDLVIDLRTGDRGAIFSFLTGAPIRIGGPGGKNQFWRELLYTEIIRNPKIAPPPAHPGADQSLRIVREMGIDVANSNPKLFITPADLVSVKAILAEAGIAPGSGFVTVNPYSRWKYKEWNEGGWGAVIDRIWEASKLPAVLIGSPQERAACQGIVFPREKRTVNLAGKTTLGELAALISMSRLHLGVDSAAPHIAAAAGTPTVTIHGPTDWRSWRVADDRHKVVCPEMGCVPCNNTGCQGSQRSKCLDELPAEPVIRAALQLLNDTNKGIGKNGRV